MAVADWYRTLFDALQTRSIGKLAEAACRILDMPVVVTDAAFIVRAKYPIEPLGDEQWDANVLNRQIEPRFVKTFSDDDHFTQHDLAGKTILTDWGHYRDAPRLTALVRSEGDVVGYFAALATDASIEPWHYEAADAISAAFGLLMSGALGVRGMNSGLTSMALYALLDGPVDEELDLSLLPGEFFAQNVAPYMLFCVRTRNPHEVPLEMYLVNQLARYFEQAVQTVYDGSLYILASSVTDDARDSARARMLAGELVRQKLYCGLSRPFDSIRAIRQKKWEADGALRVGMRLGIDEPLFHYADLVADVTCDVLDAQLPPHALDTALLDQIRRHDAESGTEYFETLKAYFECGFDKKRTVEALHIHCNTLQYRLDRLMETYDIDVNDGFYRVYFMLEDYRARVAAAEDAALGASRRAEQDGAR